MSQGMLKGSTFRKGSLLLSLLGTLAMHRPMVQGATVPAEPQQPATGAQVTGFPDQLGLQIRDEAFVSRYADLVYGTWLAPATDSGIYPATKAPLAWESRSVSLDDRSTSRLTLNPETLPSQAAPADAVPASNIHWFAFERRWLLPQSLSLDESPQVVRAAPALVPRVQPLVNSSPIPLPPATQSAIALGVAAGAYGLVRRTHRAIR